MKQQITLFIGFMLLCVSQSIGQIVSCTSNVSISLSIDGTEELTADMFIESTAGGEFDTTWVIPSSVSCDHLGELEVTVYVIDEYGTDGSCTSILLVEDKFAPVAIGDVEITVDVSNGAVTLTPEMLDDGSYDNCGPITYDVSPAFVDCDSENPTLAFLTVTDPSGNSNSVVVEVYLEGQVDYYEGVICYTPQDVNVLPGPWELTLEKVSLGGPAPCANDYTVTYENLIEGNTTPDDYIFTIDHVGQTYTVTITDVATGNACFTEITIVANGAPYGFCVSDFNNQAVENVKLTSFNTTDETGCAQVIAQATTSITATKEDDQANGVDMIDALLIRMHILAQVGLSAEQDFAADVNGDGVISTLDIVLLEKMLLGEFNFDQVWYFYDQTNPVTVNTLPENLDQFIIIEEGQGDYNFSAIKIADLDLSYNFSIPESEKFNISAKDIVLNNDETYSVDLFVDYYASFLATDFSITAETDDYMITGVTSNLEGFNFDADIHIQDGFVNLNWLGSEDNILANGTAVSANQPIFTLELKAKQNGILSSTFKMIDNDDNKMYLTSTDVPTKYIKLDVVDKITVPVFDTEYDNSLLIRPNPSSDFIVLSADNTLEGGDYSLYSLNGQLVKTGKISSNSRIDITTLNPGLYSITIKTNDGLYAQKLSVIR